VPAAVGAQHAAVPEHGAGVGLLIAGDTSKGRRLARAVGAEECHEFAALDAEAERLDRQEAAVALAEIPHLEHEARP